jgi:hypothetical protein
LEVICDNQGEVNDITKKQFYSLNTYLSEQEITSINSWILKIKNENVHKKIQQRKKHVNRAIKTLGLKYNKIGNGKTRIVFDLENGYVLKVALNCHGIWGNEKEYKLFFNSPSHIQKHLCPVKDFGYGWIIMKKMTQKPSKKDYSEKLSLLIKKFKENGIEAKDMRKNNLALSENGEIIVIDYAMFDVTGD